MKGRIKIKPDALDWTLRCLNSKMSIISPENKVILIKRFKSLAWRLGGLGAVALLNYVATNLELFNLSPQVVAMLALVCGELTKYLRVNLPTLRKSNNVG